MVVVGSPPAAEEPVRWKMASAAPGSVVILGTTAKRFTETLAAISGGDFQSSSFTSRARWCRRSRCSIPSPAARSRRRGHQPASGPARSGGGAVLGRAVRAVYRRVHGVGLRRRGTGALARDPRPARHLLRCSAQLAPPEASGWFRKEISSVDDLKGLKMRIFGLGGRVDAKVRRLDPAAGAGRRLPCPGARRDRCDRGLHAGGGS